MAVEVNKKKYHVFEANMIQSSTLTMIMIAHGEQLLLFLNYPKFFFANWSV